MRKDDSFSPKNMSHMNFQRTDLACEAGRAEQTREEREVSLAGEGTAHILTSQEVDGGRYVTISFDKPTLLGERGLLALAHVVSEALVTMSERLLAHKLSSETRVLAVGLGNMEMTADAIGPLTTKKLVVTRHLRMYEQEMYEALECCELSAVTPGVLGQTGMESGEIIKGVVAHVKPHLLVVMDALAARDCKRLATTIQLSDRGIDPGAGVGNHRMAFNAETMGCPVVALGVPTVVDSATLVYDALWRAHISEEDISPELHRVLENGRGFVVCPKDCDLILQTLGEVLARAINLAFGVGEL